MFLVLSNQTIHLDSSLSVQDRIKKCEEILSKYPEEFLYELPEDHAGPKSYQHSEKIKCRLHILGEYILRAAPCMEGYEIINTYRRKRNAHREVLFDFQDQNVCI